MDDRFIPACNEKHAVVVDIPIAKYNALERSEELAYTWVKQIAAFLNQADASLLNISKITKPL
jgi:hypothetical protein